MKIVEKTENQLTFVAKIPLNLANAIRRYVWQIPIFAIDEVEIFLNDSPMYDEALAHRLGLIPIKMEKSLDEKKVKLSLKVKKEGTVYSGDLEGNAKVVYKNMPIVILDKGQKLELVATGRFGKGSEHTKFSPGLLYYREVFELTTDKSLLEEFKKRFPSNKIEEKGGKITILDDQKKEIKDMCQSICKEKGKELELKETDEIVITIESFGQLPPEKIFKRAIECLKKDLSEVAKLAEKKI